MLYTCILIEGEAVPWAPAAQLQPIGDVTRAPSGARGLLDDAGKKEGNRKASKGRSWNATTRKEQAPILNPTTTSAAVIHSIHLLHIDCSLISADDIFYAILALQAPSLHFAVSSRWTVPYFESYLVHDPRLALQ
ncbi:hypothetical protein S7711_11312 [Stachybotrys chartarum IBT 7711]|uniref:Uncharacterized protein n=1 Tax=Stachybotrys chartarum (strain CBS 109288 / IBT 7711) TaxID=1280523 RepID=A0A084AIW4_STACB|nr:hypothetical protein S7711_11312 [Stachybotrys chartarum IBT 7711]KFA81058.1 hypothetical protein S40288_10518 [Stachybotrys chartarum IBT 40288]